MIDENENYFKSGVGVEIVFNLDFEVPMTRSSIILETNSTNKSLIIAQSTPKILPSTEFQQMHITTLVQKELAVKFRVGYQCKILRFISDYKLSNQNAIAAIELQYEKEPVEINIRSAYRLPPSPKFEVLGKMIYDGESFFTGKDFNIYNVSISGLGILIPKRIKKERNILMDIEPGEVAKVGLVLKDNTGDKEEIITISTNIRIMRTKGNHTKEYGFAGIMFIGMKKLYEEKLGRFIHEAQMFEIRKFSGMSSSKD